MIQYNYSDGRSSVKEARSNEIKNFSFASEILTLSVLSVPLIILAISLGVTQTEGYISDNYCWLSVKKGIIWAFVGPVLLVLICNFIILLIVLRVIQSTAVQRLKSKSEKLRSVVWTIFMLSPILGLTWVFGVLSVNNDLVVFQYLFAILNSLQAQAQNLIISNQSQPVI
ncbi:Adhesion G-protein coupled receptor D1 [Bulinus truncatus]|nr:Adhesion G-protein coupled receptor D1 [Bulinus truncatus]